MTKAKIIAMYLPQYHCIPENDNFWGKGFTDWVTVKNAKPLFKGHNQPRVPLNSNYYDLSLEENVVWQAKLAKEHGIYGFGVYHYWFNSETNLLTRPAEIIRDCKAVEVDYFLAWDNANWKRSWSNVAGNDWTPNLDQKLQDKTGPVILLEYIIGEKDDWKKHYDSLLSHFLSPKYIKIANKPVFVIFNYSAKIGEMCEYWDELAKEDGFSGVHFIIKQNKSANIPASFYKFKYEPLYSGWSRTKWRVVIINKVRKFFNLEPTKRIFDYDTIWNDIITNAKKDTDGKIYHSGFVSYDDSPRRGVRGTIVINSSAEKFGRYVKELRRISSSQDKEFIFLTAWNEWGEGAYLEPDKNSNFDFLNSLSQGSIDL